MISPPRKMAPGERLTAANYNALLDYVRRITPVQGANVKVDYRLCGAVISGTPGGSLSVDIKPFTVRYHDNMWEIYLPSGCVNVGGTCEPINPSASESGGVHANDPGDWRILGIDEEDGATLTDSDGNNYREFDVVVHAKTSAKIHSVDDLNADARRLFWCAAKDRLTVESAMSAHDRYRDTPGDSFSCVVAIIRVTDVSSGDDQEYARSVTQIRSVPVDVGDVPAPTGFDLVWYFSVSNGALKVEAVYCMRQVAAVAGIAVTGDGMTDVKGASDVYARIDTADMTDGSGIVEVVTDPGNAVHAGDTLVTWLPLYELAANTVTADYREASLKNIQLYRA